MFRIYYADGSTFEGDPFEAPATGVIVIVQTSESVGRTHLKYLDFYWWEDGRWFGGDQAGMLLHLIEGGGPKKVLFGKFIRDEKFHAIMRRALADPDFPAKSATNTEDRA